jgi:hypothetical protein
MINVRADAKVEAPGLSLPGHDDMTFGAGHFGGGVKLYIRPTWGIRADVKALRGFKGEEWFGRTTFGVFYQFRR